MRLNTVLQFNDIEQLHSFTSAVLRICRKKCQRNEKAITDPKRAKETEAAIDFGALDVGGTWGVVEG